MKHVVSVIVTLCVVALALAPFTSAQVPNQMQYQGRLTDEGGSPLDTTVGMVFTIYDDSVGSGVVWAETHPGVTVEDGLFVVILGSVSGVTGDAVSDSARWLGIKVGDDLEIQPRIKLVTVPYAFRVSTVDGATGGTISGDVVIQSDLDLDGDLRATGKATIGPYHTNIGSNACVAGSSNVALGSNAAVSGGRNNNAWGLNTTVGGGWANGATVDLATVCGGYSNTASGRGTAIGGGEYNDAGGLNSTVPGGRFNTADGDFSFAAGYKAKANHHGAFVWADHTDTDFASTGEDQFLIRASGGVGIGTDSPSEALDVSGTIQVSGFKMPTGASNGYVLTSDGSGAGSWLELPSGGGGWTDDGTIVRLEADTDSVGIGTAIPTEKLDVAGNIHASGTITSGTSITIDGAIDQITASGGTIDFDDENLVTTGKATIGPGNVNTGSNAFVAGSSNSAISTYATVGGGSSNRATGYASTVGGGQVDSATANYATVAGGHYNTAGGSYAAVGGGTHNKAVDSYTTVGGGRSNTASQNYATVGGGWDNEASGLSSTVPGGVGNVAGGTQSFAVGFQAKANHDGSVVIAANSGTSALDSVRSGGDAQMVIRANGGLYVTNTSELAPYDNTNLITTRGGAYLSGNGTNWTNASDRNSKENFTSLDREELLQKLAALPITRWNYDSDDDRVTHIGPNAQDFHAVFGVGKDNKSISTIDPSGIALAAIQELYRTQQELIERTVEVEGFRAQLNQLRNEKTTEIRALETQLTQTRVELDELSALVKALTAGR